jgi:tetratricopeptide (TPR) repeat protein
MTTGTQVDTLEAKGLIRLAAVQPEIEYLFRHALVQDAAYGSLLKQERRGLHAQVGQALEELYPDRREELAGVLAMHFEQAGENDKAIDYHVAAGNYGLKRNALREAYAAFDRAATLLPAEGPGENLALRRRDAEIRLGRVQSGYSFLPGAELLESLVSLANDVEALGEDELTVKVHLLVALARLQMGEAPESPPVARSLDRIREIGEQVGDPSLGALPLALVGMSNVFSGSLRTGIEQLEESLPLVDESHDSIGAAFARGALGVGYAMLGEFDRALEAAARANEIAARGDVIARLDALIMNAMIRSQMGDLEATVPLASECVGLAQETGASACVMTSSWVLGDAFHRQGRFSEARDVLARATDISGIVDRKVWRPTLLAWLNASVVALGGTEGDYEEALATARSINNRQGEAGILAKRAEAAARRGQLDDAAADYAASAAILVAEGLRPAHARVLAAWGQALRAGGRTEDAEPILRQALELFEELGIQREAAEVRTTLSLGATTLQLE